MVAARACAGPKNVMQPQECRHIASHPATTQPASQLASRPAGQPHLVLLHRLVVVCFQLDEGAKHVLVLVRVVVAAGRKKRQGRDTHRLASSNYGT